VKQAVIAFSLFFTGVLLLQAGDSTVYVKEKKSIVDRNGEKQKRVEHNIIMPTAFFRYVTHTGEQDSKLIIGKWGDYFLGTNFGRRHGNGGWSLWNFLKIYISNNGKTESITVTYPPAEVIAYKKNGNSHAMITWNISEGQQVTLKILAFPSHLKWLFFKLESNIKNPLLSMNLTGYPGNSDRPPERERVAGMTDVTVNLSKDTYRAKPTGPGFILYSRYVQTTHGLLSVFDLDKTEKVVLPKSESGISPHLYLKAGTTDYSFALGYFSDEPAERKAEMFIVENQHIVSNFLKNVDWSFSPDPELNAEMTAEVKKIIAERKSFGMPEKADFSKRLQQLSEAGFKAFQDKNFSRVREVYAEMKELKTEIIKDTLKYLEKKGVVKKAKKNKTVKPSAKETKTSACTPAARDGWWPGYYKNMLKREPKNMKVMFLGDSITMMWRSQSGLEGGTPVWDKYYKDIPAGNYGISGDKTENVLWRITEGKNLEGTNPELIVLLIGINNLLQKDTPEDTAAGVTAVVTALQKKLPKAKILLLGVFPCWNPPTHPMRGKVKKLNSLISGLADGERITFFDFGNVFLEKDGTISKEILRDHLHLSEKGYKRWAEAMNPTLDKLLSIGEK
jgi:beta-glucosidase